MRRVAIAVLAAVGPLSVAVLRFVLPYYTADDSVGSAREVAAHPGRESLVLWLGLVATMTLVPGLYAVRDRFLVGRLTSVAFALTTVGYLALPILLVGDAVLWTGQSSGLPVGAMGRLLDGLHPSYGVGLGVFVLGHVVGTTLLGVAALRQRIVPAPVAWALTISQPLHFVTTVALGLSWVDLLAWSMTAFAMAWLATYRPVRGRVGSPGPRAGVPSREDAALT